MKVTLTFMLALLACIVSGSPRNKAPEKIQDEQLLQRATCVEAPSSVTGAFAKRSREGSNCSSLAVAISRARTKAYDDAFNAVESRCRNQISAAEAEALCQGLGNFVVARATSTVSPADTIPRPGGADNIDATWSIERTSRCVTFRDFKTEVSGCTAKFKVLARCGVKCVSLE